MPSILKSVCRCNLSATTNHALAGYIGASGTRGDFDLGDGITICFFVTDDGKYLRTSPGRLADVPAIPYGGDLDETEAMPLVAGVTRDSRNACGSDELAPADGGCQSLVTKRSSYRWSGCRALEMSPADTRKFLDKAIASSRTMSRLLLGGRGIC
jgi:hypothetical protein